MNQKADRFYTDLMTKFREIVHDNGLEGRTITITGKILTTHEAIGNPRRQDFPLITGKERLMEADFMGSKGQAFTDQPGHFEGTLSDILERKPVSNFDRAVLISSINAVCRYLGLIDRSVHCRNEEPEECARDLIGFLKEKGPGKIALVGFQPSMLESIAGHFEVRNLDLDADKIGTEKFGVTVEDGVHDRDEVLEWADLIFATGSTVVNGTVVDYLDSKPVWFYGTTILGTAYLMGLNSYCRTTH